MTEPLVFPAELCDLILAGRKTQMRVPLVPGEDCPIDVGAEVPFRRPDNDDPAGLVRVLDAEAATVYGIVRGDAVAEGFPSGVKFNDWWRATHGALNGHCWRLLIEVVLDLDDLDRRLISTIYGDDGRQPAYWNPTTAEEREYAAALIGRHLIVPDSFLGGYVLSPLGRRAGRSMKVGRPT